MIVVDASLATKWLVAEADQDAALDFFERHRSEVAAPDLLLTEVAGVFVRRANQNKAAMADEAEALRRWLTSWRDGRIIAYRMTADLIARAGRIAMEMGHPIADCVYLALALELACPLATCDAKFRDKAVGTYPNIKLLAEFAAPTSRS